MKKSAAMPTSRAKTAYGLLSEIAKLAFEEPKRIRMGLWKQSRGVNLNQHPDIGVDEWPGCGSIGCVGGWVDYLRPTDTGITVMLRAGRVLGLSDLQAEALFEPNNLMDANNQGTTAHARKVIAHIRRFQKKYAAQLKAKRV